MKKITMILSAVTLIACSCSNEQGKDSVEKADSTNKKNMETPSNQPVVTDEASSAFLVDAVNGGMTEVQLGEMAQQKAVNEKVKAFAGMMVHDHSNVNDQVKALAAQRNVTLPSMIGESKQKDVSGLAKKSGNDFDKAYMTEMVKAHESTIDMYEKADGKVNDTEVKTFIANTLPKVRAHLDSAKAIRKMIK